MTSIFAFVWLISLRIVLSSSSMLLQISRFPSVLWLNNICECVCVCVCARTTSLSIHLWQTDRLLAYLHYLNNPAMNVNIISLWGIHFVSFGSIPRSGISWIIQWFFFFLGISMVFSIGAEPVYNSVQRFLFLHILANTCYVLSFW